MEDLSSPYVDIHENLLYHEEWWRDHQVFLQSRGYMLRPRLRPGWTPSWHASGQSVREAEDAIYSSIRLKLMDATRISDGKMVYIKQVTTGDQESTIVCYFDSENLRKHPDNHSVPILDIFPDVNDPSMSFMVMPFLREINEPTFEYIGEVLDFVDQVLKGLSFMHAQGVAHRRDCAQYNILMDAPDMFPRGFHPVKDWLLPDGTAFAPFKPRMSVDAKYYFVDYGISTRFAPGTPSGSVLGTLAQDHDVPELSDEVPYDAFKVDIFTVGNIFRRIFCDKFTNVDFLRPLACCMTRTDPSSRPSAAEALREWRIVCASFSKLGRCRRLLTQKDADDSYAGQVVSGLYHAVRLSSSMILGDSLLFNYHELFSQDF
ncbi:hypothetical protein OF83DRAFT_1060461 [Amylostereum chailletii]|nr:hypothetical protein OF83DRAFT_1060461 [Amylostereum chailletii]